MTSTNNLCGSPENCRRIPPSSVGDVVSAVAFDVLFSEAIENEERN